MLRVYATSKLFVQMLIHQDIRAGRINPKPSIHQRYTEYNLAADDSMTTHLMTELTLRISEGAKTPYDLG